MMRAMTRSMDSNGRWSRRGLLAAALPGVAGPAQAAGRPARLSAAFALAPEGAALDAFLAAPGHAAVEAHLRFAPDCPEEVIGFAEVAWLEGITAPRFVSAGNWRALVGVQRGGLLWVGAGTEAQRAGTPSRERAWRSLALPRRLEGGAWYRLRVQADFNRRRFVSAELEGPQLRRAFDLRGIPLDYPDAMPFDHAAVAAGVGTMRRRDAMGRAGQPLVHFDDVALVATGPRGAALLFRDGFERQAVVPPQPTPALPIRLDAYDRGRWYRDGEDALFRPEMASFARSGTRVGTADARI